MTTLCLIVREVALLQEKGSGLDRFCRKKVSFISNYPKFFYSIVKFCICATFLCFFNNYGSNPAQGFVCNAFRQMEKINCPYPIQSGSCYALSTCRASRVIIAICADTFLSNTGLALIRGINTDCWHSAICQCLLVR